MINTDFETKKCKCLDRLMSIALGIINAKEKDELEHIADDIESFPLGDCKGVVKVICDANFCDVVHDVDVVQEFLIKYLREGRKEDALTLVLMAMLGVAKTYKVESEQ